MRAESRMDRVKGRRRLERGWGRGTQGMAFALWMMEFVIVGCSHGKA